MILEGFLRAERFLELSVIRIASILVKKREQPGVTERSLNMKPECQVCQFAVTPASQLNRNIACACTSFLQWKAPVLRSEIVFEG